MKNGIVQPGRETVSWFAMRVFNKQLFRVRDEMEKAGKTTYIAMHTVDRMKDGRLEYGEVPMIPSLLFVRAEMSWCWDYKQRHFKDIMLYSRVPGGMPTPIPDAQMDAFILVTSRSSGQDIEFLGEDCPLFRQGERVRVVGGLYQGAEGVIKRIRKDRKLLVAVEGVAVVAVSKIPFEFLKPVERAGDSPMGGVIYYLFILSMLFPADGKTDRRLRQNVDAGDGSLGLDTIPPGKSIRSCTGRTVSGARVETMLPKKFLPD